MQMTMDQREALADHIESTDRDDVLQWVDCFWSRKGVP